MEKIDRLKVTKASLKSAIQIMDREAHFNTEDGRRYAQALVKLVLIQMQIEETEKEAARI
ncbi:hypothetical protein [Paenibacillus glufosinatiresistens]|uniref:hypothetical protein n=1 Tax=Paenibacillus glufosinatiresistens TaxID=3070657 RepID=UPI00286D8A28|nr:hypothetical protein [Paenibacillus sp. YX.27]